MRAACEGTWASRGHGRGRRGLILVIVMSLLAALVLLGGIAVAVLTVDLRTAGYYRTASEAFSDADTGWRCVLSRIRADIAAQTLALDQPVKYVSYAAPAGYHFDHVHFLFRLADGKCYYYRVTGHSGNSRSVLDLIIGRRPAYPLSVFGDVGVTLKPGVTVCSYRPSEIVWPPTLLNSTEEASVGCNGTFNSPAGNVWGMISLGASTNGVPAIYTSEASETRAVVTHRDRIDPDPLGLSGGDLATQFQRVALTNNNAQAVGGILHGGILTIGGFSDVTLTAGNYYVDEIDMRNQRFLTINASAGPVNIYLTGPAYVPPNADIIVTPPNANNFRIFSNSSQTINFQPKQDYIGFIYAPLAQIRMQPNGNAYGLYWGRQVDLWPGGNFFADEDLLTAWDFGPVQLVSWKEVR